MSVDGEQSPHDARWKLPPLRRDHLGTKDFHAIEDAKTAIFGESGTNKVREMG